MQYQYSLEQWVRLYDMGRYHMNCGAGCLAVLSSTSFFDKGLSLLLWEIKYMPINHN